MIGHEIITASAGSGKTWNLVVRYIRLLALGADPRSIIALTFSRKAAREFFTAILHRLAAAALTDAAAAKLAKDAGVPHFQRDDFVKLLAALVRDMPLLTLGTMDSFFVRIARSFPLELGLAGDFAILDNHQLGIEQQRVLQRVFAPGKTQEEGRKEFLAAFQQATWGKEEVRLKRLINEFLENWQGLYLLAPEERVWGNAAAIWPKGRRAPEKKMTELLTAASQAVRQAKELKAAQQETLLNFLALLESHTPGTPLPDDIKRVLKKLLEVLPELEAGEVQITLRSKVKILPPLTHCLHAVVSRLVHDTFAVCLHQTHGIHRILNLYEGYYHEMVRRQGRLTFQDVQLILSGDLSATEHQLAGASRENIDYRLDAKYAHWLLDEFQDTSRVQWRVMQNLCDEAIQDQEGERSFFAVGDEKQSIFTWRGAEPGLLGDILRFYNQPGHEMIKVTPLALSQRSGPAIIRMVNRLCGNLAGLSELEGLAGGVALWPWQEHEAARKEREGCAAVIEVPAVENEEGEAVWNACAELLRELQPLRRGLTCAVLCSRNKRAAELADVLREHSGMEVVCESDVGIATDNPAASAMLALLKAAVHPADQFSWQQVLMSPFGEVLDSLWPDAEGETGQARRRSGRGIFTATLLAELMTDGFEKTLRRWEGRLLAQVPSLDSFSRGRLDELCRAALEFDAEGSRDVDEFIAFSEARNVRESASTNAVQVMTIHKSKGLTFDIVLLPDLHDRVNIPNRIGVGRDGEKRIAWLSLLPPKDMAVTDAVFAAALEDADTAKWRERLAQLYVSVTRARHANYLLIPPVKGESVTMAAIVRHLLAEGAEKPLMIGKRECVLLDLEGDLEWIEGSPLQVPVEAPAVDLFAAMPAAVSAAEGGPVPALKIRPSAGHYKAKREGRRFGTLVHGLLSRVEWAGGEASQDITDCFERIIPHPQEWERVALETVLDCLRQDPIVRLLARPREDAVLWRERSFEAVIDGKCVSGVFDRVTIAGGTAHLVEYKTDELKGRGAVGEAVARHARQTQLYRAALRHLTGLPDENIRTSLLFTSLRQVVDVTC